MSPCLLICGLKRPGNVNTLFILCRSSVLCDMLFRFCSLFSILPSTNIMLLSSLQRQWAGKTIALGTFPSSEADEKCARAKALTRAWRSTMRPKPSREWVMVELERLGVRVVSGRLGRKAGEDDDDDAPTPRPTSSKKSSKCMCI